MLRPGSNIILLVDRIVAESRRASGLEAMRNFAKHPRVIEAEDQTALCGLETTRLLTRLRQLQQQVAQIRKDAHEASPAFEQVVAIAMRTEIIAEAALIRLSEMVRSSEHDLLTDLPNRVLMRDRLDNAIAMAHRHKSRLAVLFVDLDRFKQINDTMGHAFGDRALQLAARRLTSAIRESDSISRHGGDEFLALVPEISHAFDAITIADKLLGALAAPAHIDGQLIRLHASIGIAFFPVDGDDAETLIRCADAAMYRAKQKGGSQFEFYTTRFVVSSSCPGSGMV